MDAKQAAMAVLDGKMSLNEAYVAVGGSTARSDVDGEYHAARLGRRRKEKSPVKTRPAERQDLRETAWVLDGISDGKASLSRSVPGPNYYGDSQTMYREAVSLDLASLRRCHAEFGEAGRRGVLALISAMNT